MRMHEILNEGPLPQIDPDKAHKLQYAIDTGKTGDHDFEILGAGCEAVVLRDPNDPDITKVVASHAGLKTCGYLQYVLASKKHSNANPYLPKIHSVTNMGPSQGYHEFEVKMEHLYELSDLSTLESTTLWNKIFNDTQEDVKYYELAKVIAKIIKFQRMPENIPGLNKDIKIDPLLLRVANLIHKIQQSAPPNSGMRIDIHDQNMMIRRTSVGQQLVITDPLYNDKVC